jgi:outer membrane lipoprotein-sorting protein
MFCRLLLALSVVACSLPTYPAFAQTVEEVVAKNLEARGGIDKIKSIQTIKQVARLNSQGMDVSMTMYGKRPNMTRKELMMGQQRILYVFDGKTAWVLNPLTGSSAPTAVTGPELEGIRQEADFDSPFVDYKTKGYSIALVGTEDVAGRKMHHLRLTSKIGAVQECYLDAETGLEARTVSPSPMGALEEEFSDYRDVQGVKMPFSVRTLQNGRRVAEITIERIELNGAIDDEMFKRPAK